jgi:hypothetical protein
MRTLREAKYDFNSILSESTPDQFFTPRANRLFEQRVRRLSKVVKEATRVETVEQAITSLFTLLEERI